MRTPQNGEKIGTDVRRKRLPRRLALQITRIRVTTWTSMRRLSSEETPNSFERRKKEKKSQSLRMRACLCKRTKQRVEPRADERAHFSVSRLIRHLREVKRSSAAAPPRIFFFFRYLWPRVCMFPRTCACIALVRFRLVVVASSLMKGVTLCWYVFLFFCYVTMGLKVWQG